jgi:pimeloyl-ACP methyl ester carboxylesterase
MRGLSAAMIALVLVARVAGERSTSTNLAIASGDVKISATITPGAGNGRRPALVTIGGSGPATRGPLQPFVDRLVEAGVTTLAYDKRGTGESTGDRTAASLDDLTQDAAAAIAALRTRPDVDPNRIGVWAISQGGWIVPKLAARTRLAFAIVVTGGGIRPRDLERASYAAALDRAAVSGDERAAALALVDRYLDYLDTGRGYDELRSSIAAARQTAWLAALGIERVLPTPATRPAWNWVATFDPVPLIAKMRMPALVMLGARDILATEAAARWNEGFERAGNHDAQVVVVPDAAHALQREHRLGAPPVHEYDDLVRAFLTRHGLM